MVPAEHRARGKSRAVAKTVQASPLTVCLLSSHAGLTEGLKRFLSDSGFRIKSVKLNFVPGFDPVRLSVPRAAVYVVDASAPRQAVKALVGGIQTRFPRARFVILDEGLEDKRVFAYLHLGAKGIIRYAEMHSQLPLAVQALAGGGFWVPRTVLSRFVDLILKGPSHPSIELGEPKLSRRECEVLDRLLEGHANKEIADKLHISERTVKFYVSSVLAKFKVRRRTDLILLAFQEARTSP